MDKQKEQFVKDTAEVAARECNGDSACIQNLKAHFGECIKGNYSKQKKGKYNKKYALDKAVFDNCINSFK